MATADDLYRQLLEMPRRDYSDLIKKVDYERRKAFELEEARNPVRPDMTRDEFANWIGRRHYFVDKGISRVLFLPSNSPPEEVRLLEVNELAIIPEAAPIEAFDFQPDIQGIPYSVFVADVTPQQFEAIRAGDLALPDGWNLDGFFEISPASR